MSKGHRSEVPELYCVFASKTLQCEGPSEGCLCCERPLRAISVRPLLPKETSFAAVLSGKTVFSPEETSFFIYDGIR